MRILSLTKLCLYIHFYSADYQSVHLSYSPTFMPILHKFLVPVSVETTEPEYLRMWCLDVTLIYTYTIPFQVSFILPSLTSTHGEPLHSSQS